MTKAIVCTCFAFTDISAVFVFDAFADNCDTLVVVLCTYFLDIFNKLVNIKRNFGEALPFIFLQLESP